MFASNSTSMGTEQTVLPAYKVNLSDLLQIPQIFADILLSVWALAAVLGYQAHLHCAQSLLFCSLQQWLW